MKVEIIGDWKEDFAWCPSQLYLNLRYGKRYFVIYLRWRHTDPWTAELIETKSDYEITGGDWYKLDVPNFRDNQYKELKGDVVPIAKAFIHSGQINLKN